MSSQKLLIFIYFLYGLKFWEEYDIMDLARSDKIKAGLQRSFQSGKSAKASIVCYGYRVDSKGKLQIYPAEAAHVLYIFERFAAGDSLGKISDALFLMDIPSPAGKEIWSKETLRKILSNEKYKGCVTLQKTFVENYLEHRQIKNKGQLDIYQIDCNHSPIIYTEN